MLSSKIQDSGDSPMKRNHMLERFQSDFYPPCHKHIMLHTPRPVVPQQSQQGFENFFGGNDNEIETLTSFRVLRNMTIHLI